MLGLWLAGALARTASAQIIIEYPIPTAEVFPESIAAGPDGALWFTEYFGTIGRITVDGSIEEFPGPVNVEPFGITAGPDGNLWFAEQGASKIGRITLAGVVDEFPTPTSLSGPRGIAAGPDGNLWFVESSVSQIGRITTSGIITEFPVPTADSAPFGITAGPEGNLWFTEGTGNKIGRITPSGTITEFDVPTASSFPFGITVGPDNNLWFTEHDGQKIGRITTGGLITEFPSGIFCPYGIAAGQDGNLWCTDECTTWVWRITTSGVETPFDASDPSKPRGIASGPDGAIWFTEWLGNKIGKLSIPPAPAVSSILPSSGPASGGTAVVIGGALFEQGAELTIGGEAAANVVVASAEEIHAEIPALPPGTLSNVTVRNPDEGTATLAGGFFADFLDVQQADIFHGYVEKIFRDGVTAGCGQGNYCRDIPVYRAPMAVFLLKAEHGATYSPPPCTGIFADLLCPGNFTNWVERLHAEGITGGCGGGNYCPSDKVTRAQMSAFLLKTKHGASYVPPPCAGIFGDVDCPSLFADWIEQLYAEGITGGCSTSPLLYCPGSFNTRGQMAVFLVKTFNLP